VPSLKEILEDAVLRLKQAGVESPRLNAELLFAHALGTSRGMLPAMHSADIDADSRKAIEALLQRRLKREPIDYILGTREFYSRELTVRPGVLVPRPETETIIDAVLKLLPCEFAGNAADIGAGSGALAVTLACEFTGLRVLATDISAAALNVTRENAAKHGVGARVFCARMDGLAAAAGGFDLIVSNPPYIDPETADSLDPEVHDYEPHEALFGGKEGVEIAQRLLAQVAERLKPGGLCLFEHGFDQGKRMRELARQAGLKKISTLKDLTGLERVLVARG
jgi:release factor glutamine methyltransferase